MSNLSFYFDVIKRELDLLEEGKFTGNIELKPNFKDGSIANMNISLHKSVKKPEVENAR